MHFSIGTKHYNYPLVDSTNEEAKRAIEEGVELPCLFTADRQSSGRGRGDHRFFSAKGGVYMTLAVPYEKRFGNPAGITVLAASATAKGIEDRCKLKVDIKWVNDIFYKGKKLAGVLCEMVADKETLEPKAVLIGIGVNLNVTEFPEEIRDIAGTLDYPEVTPRGLCLRIVYHLFDMLYYGRDFMTYYKCRNLAMEEDIIFRLNGEEKEGHVEDIDKVDGSLLVRLENEELIRLSSGEISIKPRELDMDHFEFLPVEPPKEEELIPEEATKGRYKKKKK